MRTISSKGLELIARYEGFRALPYRDVKGVPTIGYGSTFYPDGRRVTMNDHPVTESLAREMLELIANRFARQIDPMVRKDITQDQFDALVSLTYNIGPPQFSSSTLLRVLNNDPKDPTIPFEFCKWTRSGNRRWSGLAKRRLEEAAMYYL